MRSVFLAIALLAVNGCDQRTKAKSEEVAAAGSSKPEPAKPDVATAPIAADVTAQRLFLDYQANEIGADANYRGKVLRVAGIVERVTRSALDEPYVVFRTSSRSLRVQANFADEAALVSLKPGQEIAVRCLGEGKVLAALVVSRCVLEVAK